MKQFIKFFIALAAMTVSTTSAWGATKEIRYLTYSGGAITKATWPVDAEPITSTSNYIEGWYYVEGTVTIDRSLWLDDDTYLILCDDAELKINVSDFDGIFSPSHNITIYAQSSGSHAGKLTITSQGNGIANYGNVTINGGNISIKSTSFNGIYCTNFSLNGGKVDIDASSTSGYGILALGDVTINGGSLSVTGSVIGIYTDDDKDVTINGGKFSTTGGTTGIDSGPDIILGWTNAEDYIECSSYNKNPTAVSGKVFDIEGGGTFGGGAVVDKESLAGKKLTPNTTNPVYTISLGSGISSDNVSFDRVKAFAGERVAVTVTPPAGKILASISYDDATTGHALNQEVIDYVITMPAHDVTVNATFVTPVAQIGDTKYANLASALADVKTSDTEITMIENSTESYLTGTVPGSHSVIINLNSKTVSIDKIDVPSALTIKNGTLECSTLYTASVGFETELIFDNATVTITDELQWPSNNIILQGGANVTLHNVMWYAGGANSGDDGADFTIADNASKFTLVNCTVSGYNPDRVYATMSQWVQPGKTLVVNGTTKNNLTLRRTWGIQLTNHLGKSVYETGVDRVTATFFDGGTTAAPNSETFNPTAYPDANAVVEIDNSDGKAHYVIVHLVPTENDAAGYYWTDPQLIRALDYGGALSRAGSPTIELGEKLILLKRDTYDDNGTERTAYNGAGWYYYKLDKDHSVANGYTESALEGFAPQRFILGEFNVTQSSDLKTVTATTDGWSAEILFDPTTLNYKFDGSERTPVITSITVKNGSNVMATLTDAEDIANQITVGSKHTIGNTPLELGAGLSWFDHNLNDASVAHFIISVPLSVADNSAPKGTSANPWLVKSAADMNLFSLCVNYGEYEFTNEWVKLNNDITYDATTSDGFKPVGYSDYTFGKRFLGSFDGNYCVISGLEYDSNITIPHFVGLFGNVSKGDGADDVAPTIKDLTLNDCSFTAGNEYVRGCGALAGFLSNGTVSNVAVHGCTVTGSVKNENSIVGGVVGSAEDKATIFDCSVDKSDTDAEPTKIINVITDTSLDCSNYTGGIVGYAKTSVVDHCAVADATICSVTPATTTPRDSYTGGVVGNSFVSDIHDNLVLRTTKIIDQIGSKGDNYVAAIIGFKGNAVGDGSGGTKLAHNYYDKAVTVSYKNSTMTAATTLDGYVRRGFRDIVIEEISGVDTKTKDEYVDIVSEGSTVTDGAKMWVFPATIDFTKSSISPATSAVTFTQTVAGTDCYATETTGGKDYIYYAPGDNIVLDATYHQTVDDGRTFYESVTVDVNDDENIVVTQSVPTQNGTEYACTFAFAMPDDDATVNADIVKPEWFTIATNEKKWMTFFHNWEAGSPADYAVTDYTGSGKTVAVKTIKSIDAKSGEYTLTDITGGVCFSGVPTLFYCDGVLPAVLKFAPVTGATAPDFDGRFIGTDVEKDLSDAGDGIYVMNGEGDFYLAYDKTEALGAHKCYVNLGSSAGSRLLLVGDGTTAVSTSPKIEGDGSPWFDLQGRRLGNKPATKGLYIHNGKKTIIK